MDFALSPELVELSQVATEVGRHGADRRRIAEDGWLIGHDPGFARTLAQHKWIGMTWPTEVGGGGRSALERFVVFEALIGTPDNSFGQVMRQMEHERGGIDRLVSNHRLYRECLTMADRDDPLVRQEIAALESAYRLGRLMVLRAVCGQAPRGYSAATKTFCTEHEQRVAAFCVEVLGVGAQAFEPVDGDADHLAARVARNSVYAPAYTLMGGTTQILRNIIAERMLGLPRI